MGAFSIGPSKEFFGGAQWRTSGDWANLLKSHCDTTERMLGVAKVSFGSIHQQWTTDVGKNFGTEDTVVKAPCGVFFGEPGETVKDP
jgi:cholesterol oxidase